MSFSWGQLIIITIIKSMIFDEIERTWVEKNYGAFFDEFKLNIKNVIREVEMVIIKINRHNVYIIKIID